MEPILNPLLEQLPACTLTHWDTEMSKSENDLIKSITNIPGVKFLLSNGVKWQNQKEKKKEKKWN